MLILKAWGISNQHLTGPSWLDTERYTIRATLAPDIPANQLGPMLQRLLTERFRIASHHESRSLRAYELTVARDGLRMARADPANAGATPFTGRMDTPAKDADGCPVLKPGGRIALGFWSRGVNCDTFRRYSIADLAAWLGRFLPAVSEAGDVIDKTGLSGEFDFRLRYEGPQFANIPMAGGASPQENVTGAAPTIFAALEQQLGLQLKPLKTQSDVLVIDHADKDPTGN
jgi:uncharacterized protein (TIGR03435 family)